MTVITGTYMSPGKRGGATAALLALLMLAGCSSSRLIASPSPAGPPLGLSATGDELGLVLTRVLVPNGPGAWVTDASWHEYTLTVRNLSDRPVTIERVRLVDPRGLYVDPSVNPLQLEKTSDALAAQYKDLAEAAAPAAVGATSLLGAGALMSALAPPVGLVVLPAYGVYKASKSHTTAQEREELERELTRRQLPSFTLSGNATVSGSVFFPIVPSPRALAVDYRVGREVKELVLPMSARGGVPPADSASSAPGRAPGAGGGPDGRGGEEEKESPEGATTAAGR